MTTIEELTCWATEIGQAYEDIALILLVEPAGDRLPIRICLVMRDGATVPWFAEGKGIDGRAYATVPGREAGKRILADERFRLPGLRLYMNFCDSRAMMFTYDGAEERLAGEELMEVRYRILYPDRRRVPPLEEFFYLWGRETEGVGSDP